MCIVRQGAGAGKDRHRPIPRDSGFEYTGCSTSAARSDKGVLIDVRAQIISTSMRPAAVPYWLIQWGALGLFSVAAVESSVMPLTLPGSTDLLLLWLVANGGEPWILAVSAVAGSLLGGYSTWEVGRSGGEAALRRYVPARLLGKIMRWVKRHPVLAVFLPAVLPPPIPALPFVLASGALRVSRGRFLAIFAAARVLRYSLIAWLGVHYGQAIVSVCTQNLDRWSTPLLWTFGVLLAVSGCLGIWKVRRVHRSDANARRARRSAAALPAKHVASHTTRRRKRE